MCKEGAAGLQSSRCQQKAGFGRAAGAAGPQPGQWVQSDCCAVLRRVVSCCVAHVVVRRVQSEQATLTNLNAHLQTLQQAKGQKLQMFGPHATLRRMVDQNM